VAINPLSKLRPRQVVPHSPDFPPFRPAEFEIVAELFRDEPPQ